MTSDERIARLEKWLGELYATAEKDMRVKWDEHLARQEKRAERLLSRVRNAKTPEAKAEAEAKYKDFLKNRVFAEKYYKDMVAEMARQYADAGRRAAEIVNGERLGAFADGYNFSAGEINRAAIAQDIGIRFDLCDAGTIEHLAEHAEDLLLPPKDDPSKVDLTVWNVHNINGQVTQGIMQGESIPKIAARLENVTHMNEVAAVRTARTMTTAAENAGRVQSMKTAEGWGVKTRKKWLCTHDSRTRHSHLLLDGETVDNDAEFSNKCRYPGDPNGPAAEVWNCFVGETKIAADCEIVRSYKHEYSGKLITVKTAGGVKFSCTPNHPILTPNGWVAAESLNRGDDLLVTSVCDGGTAGIEPDIDHAFPRIEAIHEFFDKLGGERTCALGVNFHGDVATSEVEIIAKKGFLRGNENSGIFKCVDEVPFKHSDTLTFRFSHPVAGFRGVNISALRFMRGLCKTLTLFGRRLGHAVIHGFGAVSRGDSAVFQAETDGVPRDVQFISEGFDGLPGKVLRDNIIDIKIAAVSHIPVYNLQTENGYYFVNDIIPQNGRKVNGNFAIAHNCRCTLITVVDGFSSNLPKRKEDAVHVTVDGEKLERGGNYLRPSESDAEKEHRNAVRKLLDTAKNKIKGALRIEPAALQEESVGRRKKKRKTGRKK